MQTKTDGPELAAMNSIMEHLTTTLPQFSIADVMQILGNVAGIFLIGVSDDGAAKGISLMTLAANQRRRIELESLEMRAPGGSDAF